MRYGEKCPCGCGYIENLNWRPILSDITCDGLEAENGQEIIGQHKAGEEWEDGQWAYRLIKNGKWLYRLSVYEYRARGGFWRPKGLGKSIGHKALGVQLNKERSKQQKVMEAYNL